MSTCDERLAIEGSTGIKVLAVTNIFPTAADPSQGTFVEQQIRGLRAAGVQVEVVHFDRRGQGMSAYRNIARVVREAERRVQPHVVHAMYGGMLGHHVVRATRRPSVVSICGSDLLGDAGSGWVRRNIFGRYRQWASHRAAARASAIIVKSENLFRALPAGVDRNKVTILPNGIDLNRFRPLDRDQCRSELGHDPNRFQVLFVDSKGQALKRRWLAEAAVEELRREGIPAELQAIQRVPHDQVARWINAADALIITSIHEGSPNIVKETLACNVPVVSVDAGDVQQRISGIAGCFLCEANASALAAGLRRVYLGRRRVEGRRAMEDLSIGRTAERLIEVYRRLIAKPPATANTCRPLMAGTAEGR